MKKTVVGCQWSVVSGVGNKAVSAAALCVLLLVSFTAVAQAPANPPKQSLDGAPASPPQRASSPGTPNAMGRPADVNSPAQAGRQALYKYLDDIAAKDEAVRRETIAGITTREQAELRQQEVRAKILDLMGGGFERTPLNAKVVGSTQMDGFRIEKVLYESQPNFFVTALLYVPENVTSFGGKTTAGPSTSVGAGAPTSAQDDRVMGERGAASAQDDRSLGRKLPAVVMAPGHAASGKAGDDAMASTFARNGFVVLSYDPIGQGERLQYPDPAKATAVQQGSPYLGASLATKPTGEHGEAGLQPTLIGDAVARYFGWDGIRAVDYLVSRPEVDAEKIGALGCSGGGAMTALLGAADKRVKAVATACYLTTMDTLLPSIGAQDAEQSVPGFIASGFDFADWVELAAPRAYAMVGTVSDMFPWKGFLETATEARRFYSLFDARAAGVVNGGPMPATPTGPTLNPDTANKVAADSPFQVIAGIGGHGNLRPITAQIVGFFLVNLAGRSADTFVAGPGRTTAGSFDKLRTSSSTPVGAGAPTSVQDDRSVGGLPKGALQVTATGQVATSYPGSETVFSLNLKRAKEKIPQFMGPQTLLQVQTDVREVTGAEAVSGKAAVVSRDLIYGVAPNSKPIYNGDSITLPDMPLQADTVMRGVQLTTEAGITLHADVYVPAAAGRHAATLMLRENVLAPPDAKSNAEEERLRAMAKEGTLVLETTPRPSPAGGEEIKSPILGPFYLTELRAELVGKTLLGMRVDDVIRAVDYLASRPDVDTANITVEASGHMGLVALHAAVLDKRIKHVTVDHVLESYRSLLEAPMPLDAPQDILPGVLLKYDVPDLVRVLGARVTATEWLKGTDNLAVK